MANELPVQAGFLLATGKSTVTGETRVLRTDDSGNLAVSGSPNLTGTWSYYAGASGTVNVAAGQRILGISCHSTVGGSFTIAGGNSIPVPANVSVDIDPKANITGPVSIVFTGTDTYFVEVIQ